MSNVDVDQFNTKFFNIPMLSALNNRGIGRYLLIKNTSHVLNTSSATQENVRQVLLSIKSNFYDPVVNFYIYIPQFIKLLLPKLQPYITHIMNTIITTCCFPKRKKRARILPILKRTNDHRSITILTQLPTVFEKLLYKQIRKHLLQHYLADCCQSKHNCATVPTKITDAFRSSTDVRNNRTSSYQTSQKWLDRLIVIPFAVNLKECPTSSMLL